MQDLSLLLIQQIRPKFDPASYGLDPQFRLTDFTKLKG